jgi:F-type H+-transporting ATPase subunit delta
VREPTIARNYALALFELGEKLDATDRFADLMAGLASAIETDATISVVLESPRVPKQTKERILNQALRGLAPEAFLRFLAAVVKRGRQGLLPLIQHEYGDLVDAKYNRIHAGVTLAREPDEQLQAAVAAKLSEVTGKEVIPHFRIDPAILGGVILRMDDRLIDGSLRRRMARLRHQLLNA